MGTFSFYLTVVAVDGFHVFILPSYQGESLIFSFTAKEDALLFH